MASKTQRILSYLPETFQVTGSRSPLKAVVEPFGNELLQAENCLAALMRAHWVDHADHGAQTIDDLARLASLYGLAPRADQDVEAFRAHLKQFIKTALEGTVTVQGLLRTAANNLGLPLADDYSEMDTWWTRPSDRLTLVHHCGNDLAHTLFGEAFIVANGHSAKAAQLTGQMALNEPIDLTGQGVFTARTLRIKINDLAKVTVDLMAAAADPSAATVMEIVDAINAAFTAPVAVLNNNVLVLTALSSGADSRIEVEEHSADATPLVLGIAPATGKGQSEAAASITGRQDLSTPQDLSRARYLRLRLDNVTLAEIDCAGANPHATTLDEITTAINTALEAGIATHDGTLLSLTSATKGVNSSVVLLRAAAQDAVSTLFGEIPSAAVGHDKLAAKISGTPDLTRGVDLRTHYLLRIRVNTAAAVNVDCRGLDPSTSQLPEIVHRINDTLGKAVASHDGHRLVLQSSSKGTTSKLTIEPLPEHNAAEVLLGINARSAVGADATHARIVGTQDLSAGVNLLAERQLRVALGMASPQDIALANRCVDPKHATLDEISNGINNALGEPIAHHDGRYLSLTSQQSGALSQVKVLPATQQQTLRFTTRAELRDEAADKIFGMTSVSVSGADAEPAQVIGQLNLTRGIDLREAQYLALQINQQPVVTVDCAGPRPRATLLEEVIARINAAFGYQLASAIDGRLKLTAPVEGHNSRIEFHVPRVTDASDVLLGGTSELKRGTDATSVILTGVKDLSAPIDLSVNHTLNLAIDGGSPKEINCAGTDPAKTTLSQVTVALNVAFGRSIATHDGKHLILFSKNSGESSSIEISAASANDATEVLLGIATPRRYSGDAARSARIVGKPDLTVSNLDLSKARYLSLSIDGQPPQVIDCAASAIDPAQVTLAEVISAVNDTVGQIVAADHGGLLSLASPTVGLSSRIQVQPVADPDAREPLFGVSDTVYEGRPASAAHVKGEIDLTRGVDLSARNVMSLAVDGQPPVKFAIRGGKQDQVFAEEIADAINRAIPGLAAVTDGAFITLTSPSVGRTSRIELQAIRHLLLQEYLPAESPQHTSFVAQHGTTLQVVNSGTTEAETEIIVDAVNGVFGVGLVNLASDWRIRLFVAVKPREQVCFSSDKTRGVQARIRDARGNWRQADHRQLEVGPQLPQMMLPDSRAWRLSRGRAGVPMLVLNNHLAPDIVQLTAQKTSPSVTTEVRVQEADLLNLPLANTKDMAQNQHRVIGRLVETTEGFHVLDGHDTALARLISEEDTMMSEHVGTVVTVTGRLSTAAGGGGLHKELRVFSIACLYDVTVTAYETGQADLTEVYRAVTIGEKALTELALQQRLLFGEIPSVLLRATSMNKASVLTLARGKSHWRYLECFNSRFDYTHFNSDKEHLGRFAGGVNVELALIDGSQIHYQPPAQVSPVCAEEGGDISLDNRVTFAFSPHRAGTVRIILPVDLPARYGARFNQALFSLPADKPETFRNLVTEPPDDDHYLVTVVNAGSQLIIARHVPRVPLGFSAHTLPFSRPVNFINGNAEDAAKMYLREPEVGGFLELAAKAPGAWGNQLSVSLCPAGPAMFTLQVYFPGSRFENAREVVRGEALTGVTNETLKPKACGVRHAKAAGVDIDVTRENCDTTVIANHPSQAKN